MKISTAQQAREAKERIQAYLAMCSKFMDEPNCFIVSTNTRNGRVAIHKSDLETVLAWVPE